MSEIGRLAGGSKRARQQLDKLPLALDKSRIKVGTSLNKCDLSNITPLEQTHENLQQARLGYTRA